MHRKSLEAAEQLKDDNEGDGVSTGGGSGAGSDHDVETSTSASMRTEGSDASVSNNKESSADEAEAFRNNSIACLRAKAQQHRAELLTHNLMMHAQAQAQAQSSAREGSCDANQNSLLDPTKQQHPQPQQQAIF